jgi:hypothetical protein
MTSPRPHPTGTIGPAGCRRSAGSRRSRGTAFQDGDAVFQLGGLLVETVESGIVAVAGQDMAEDRLRTSYGEGQGERDRTGRQDGGCFTPFLRIFDSTAAARSMPARSANRTR